MAVEQETDLKATLRASLTEQCVAIRQRRRTVEQKWLNTRSSWMNTHYAAKYRPTDSDPFNYDIPTARRTTERTAVRITKLLTPSVKWFEILPMRSNTDQMRLSNVDAFLKYVIQKKIKSRSNISQLSRCMLLYGMAILKTSVQIQKTQVWPYQRAVDPFAFYMFPETCPYIEEAEVVFEDFLFSYERYRTFMAKGIVDPYERSAFGKPDWPYHLAERLAYQGITDPTAGVDIRVQRDRVSAELEKTTTGFVSMTELWIRREGVLYQVYIGWNFAEPPTARIVGFYRSEYDQPLYRSAVARPLPGETYTNNQYEDVFELDTIQKDLFNQFMSAVTWEQGIVIEGEAASNRTDTNKMKGRSKWRVDGDPREAYQFIAPQVTSTNFLRAWQIAVANIQSMAGSGTIAEGQPGRNMPRAGFAVNNLINLGMSDIQDIAEVIEQEILTPGLSDIYKVCRLIPDEQLMLIPGGQAFYQGMQNPSAVLKRQDILGDFEFEWVGSLQFQDENQRAQRGLVFMNALMTAQPMLMQQGLMPNWAELIPMLWRHVLGERGLEKVLIPMPQQPQPSPEDQLSQLGQPGQPPQNGQQSRSNQQQEAKPGPSTPGLSYNAPSATNGFVQQA